MYILLFIAILAIVYIRSFKDGFDQELLQKVSTVVIAVTIAILLICIISSIMLR